jgi:N-acetylglucosaminyldiphosphoundecaprenol N-acetyl-beta-D-mannosaminyltransferase
MDADRMRAILPVPRANVLGVGIHALNMESAVRAVEAGIDAGIKGYVCVTGVHGVMEAQKDPGFLAILNRSFLTTPDGTPTVWVGRSQHFSGMGRVYGPDLMLEVCRISPPKRYTHFLYGGKPGVVEVLRKSLETRFPGIRIVGSYTPPFRPLNPAEEEDLLHYVSRVRPDCFWVGLSTPRQERFMAEFVGKLDAHLMFGVGAAFDIHAGLLKDSPQWIKKAGFQWLHRMLQEPRRLARRYFTNNPHFLLAILLQTLRLRRYPAPAGGCLAMDGSTNNRPKTSPVGASAGSPGRQPWET